MIQGDFLSSEVMTTNNGFHQKSFANLAKLRQIYKTYKAEIMCRKELVSHMMFNSGKKSIGGMPNIRLEKNKLEHYLVAS